MSSRTRSKGKNPSKFKDPLQTLTLELHVTSWERAKQEKAVLTK